MTLDGLDAFESELLAGGIATLVLERRAGGRVHAEVDRALYVAPDAQQRQALGVDRETVSYRSVRLMHGDTILSEAEIWFVPSRLDPEMATALAETDQPFGSVIRALAPTRLTLSVERPEAGAAVLRIRALVLDGEGRALAEVSEAYRAAAISGALPAAAVSRSSAR